MRGRESVYGTSTGVPEKDPGKLDSSARSLCTGLAEILTAEIVQCVRNWHGSDGRARSVRTGLAREYQTMIQENLMAELVQCVQD